MTVLALTGGVGGAKLALGLTHVLTEQLVFLVNTAAMTFPLRAAHFNLNVDTLDVVPVDIANLDKGGERETKVEFHGQSRSSLG